jgi:hypothetical protein
MWAWSFFTPNTLPYLFQILSELAPRQLIDYLAFLFLVALMSRNVTPRPSVAFFSHVFQNVKLGIGD